MASDWNGLPENPERDGAHVLSWRRDDPEPAWWIAREREWQWQDRDICSAITASNNARYLGPCRTPADLLAECERAAGIATASTEKEASK